MITIDLDKCQRRHIDIQVEDLIHCAESYMPLNSSIPLRLYHSVYNTPRSNGYTREHIPIAEPLLWRIDFCNIIEVYRAKEPL